MVERELKRKDQVIKKKAVDKLRDMIKSDRNMRETIDQMRWGIEEINHKEQKLSWDYILTIKDHILKKCPWFYEFGDIFYKHPSINLFFSIESRQPPKCDKAAIDEDNLEGYNFDLDQD